MDSTRNLIDYAMDSNGVEFRNELYASIHDRVTAAIESKKQELAGSLIRQEAKEEDEEGEEGTAHEKAEKKMMKSLDRNGDGKHTMADHQKEENQGIMELSNKTMKQYRKQAQTDIDTTDDAGIYNDSDADRVGRRSTGIHRATLKINANVKKDKAISASMKKEENEEQGENAEKKEERPKTPNAFTMKSKGPSDFAKSSSGGKTKETKTGRTHSSGDRY